MHAKKLLKEDKTKREKVKKRKEKSNYLVTKTVSVTCLLQDGAKEASEIMRDSMVRKSKKNI